MSIAYNNKQYYREKICKPKVNHGVNSSDFFLYSRFILNTVAIGANGFARSSSDFLFSSRSYSLTEIRFLSLSENNGAYENYYHYHIIFILYYLCP